MRLEPKWIRTTFPRSGSLKVGLVLLGMSDEPGEKGCTGCDRTLPSSHFHVNKVTPSGLESRCKDCKSDYSRRRHDQEKLDRRMGDEPEPAEEPAAKKPRLEPEDLYVMAMSTDPRGAVHGLKVGRSGNITQRAQTLCDSMPFSISVLATFPGAGHLEKRVHTMLEDTRNTAGRGREWFHVTLPHVIHTVACVMVLTSDAQGSIPGS